MKEKLKFSGRCLSFVLVACLMLSGLNRILRIKSWEGNYYNAPGQFENFYSLEKNSTDVLLIGSSHMFYNICPQELYDRYGLRSYNLGTPGQNVVCSYYVLEEALKYQNPKAVVLETFYFYKEIEDIWNEGAHRKAVSWMRWSPTKLKAVFDICKVTPELKVKTFLLENICFHNHWKELTQEDFDFSYYSTHNENKGYLPRMLSVCSQDITPYEPDSASERNVIPDVHKDYISRIARLCSEKDIKLVFYTTPFYYWGQKDYWGVKDFADELDVPYYDFGEVSLNQLLEDYDYRTDCADDFGHANIKGAKKLTDGLGKVLTEDLGITGRQDVQWEDTKDYYAKLQKEDELRFITDLPAYLKAIDRPEYTVFFSVNDEATVSLSDEAKKAMQDLGLNTPIGLQDSYLAVIDKGKVIHEEAGNRILTHKGTLEKESVIYELESAGFNQGCYSHITLSDIHGRHDYSRNRRGINIVVYDSYDNAVIDSAVFDTWDEGMPCYR